MKITVNGKENEAPDGSTVSELLERLSIPPLKTLVSINDQTLTNDEFDSIRLKEGDIVDLFTFVAGG